jgi:uncharacterized protein (TIGR02246 family)
MLRRFGWLAILFCVAGMAAADDSKPAPKNEEAHRFFKSLAEHLHKRDAKGVAAHFAPKSLHVQKSSGTRTEGREAIQALYEGVFKPGRVKSVDFGLDDLRQVTADVISVKATATVTRNDGPAVRTLLSAILTRHDGKWLIDSVEEQADGSAPKPFETLQSLDWLVGDWKDEDGKLTIRSKCEWTDEHSFLTRTFSVSENGKTLHEGSQKIGFDAVDGVIRSWNFETDGSFGEGYWTFDGKVWTVTLRGRTADGLIVSATQIITPTGQDSFTTQLVSREVGGKILPNGPVVKVVREKETK